MPTLYIVMFFNLLFSTIGDYLAKMWGLTNQNSYLYIALVVSLLTSFFYFSTIKYSSLMVGPSVLLILTLVISVAMGYFWFNERVSVTQTVGIVLGLTAVILILDLVKIRF
ncbi:MAG: EamA family transporter [Patescibacteria group bacterium]